MATATTPTVCKTQLGKLLALHRERANLTQDQAARLISRKNRHKIVMMETAQGGLTPAELDLLLDGYAITDPEMRELLRRLRDNSSQRGRWTGYRAVHDEGFRRYIDFEEDADLIRVTEVEVIPGLLQTESYVRAMFTSRYSQTEHSLEDRLQSRLARQRILTKTHPPEARFVISESCLRREWGDHAVMHQQIEHLITCSELPNVLIQVMPFKVPAGGQQTWIGARITLLRVPAPGLAGPLEVAYTELGGGLDYRFDDDKTSLATYDASWTRLSDSALNARESRAFLRTVADSYR